MAGGNVDAALKYMQMNQPEQPEQTDDMVEYNAAVKQGFKGSFMDFMETVKGYGKSVNTTNVDVNTGSQYPELDILYCRGLAWLLANLCPYL